MTYRQAVKAAIASWKGIWGHWNKSAESASAVTALEKVMDDDLYDDRLKPAVDWFIGDSAVQFTYMVPFSALKKDSALYKKLKAELAKADPPNYRPSVSMSAMSHIPPPAPVRASVRAVLPSVPQSSIQPTPAPAPTPAPSPTPAPVTIARATPVMSMSSPAPSLSSGPSPSSSVVAPTLPFARHYAAWKEVKITDIPTETPGVYISGPDDYQTINQRGSAQMITIKAKGLSKSDNPQVYPEYWLELGRLISRTKNKVGRCFSCAGVVVHTLVSESEYDALTIMVVGNPSRDHYFVLVGNSAMEIKAQKGYAIDIWDSNLRKTPPVNPIKGFLYVDKHVKPFCTILPTDRVGLRAFLAERNS